MGHLRGQLSDDAPAARIRGLPRRDPRRLADANGLALDYVVDIGRSHLCSNPRRGEMFNKSRVESHSAAGERRMGAPTGDARSMESARRSAARWSSCGADARSDVRPGAHRVLGDRRLAMPATAAHPGCSTRAGPMRPGGRLGHQVAKHTTNGEIGWNAHPCLQRKRGAGATAGQRTGGPGAIWHADGCSRAVRNRCPRRDPADYRLSTALRP